MDKFTLEQIKKHLTDLTSLYEGEALKYSERLTGADFNNLTEHDYTNINSMCECFDKLRSVRRSIKALDQALNK